MDLTIVFILYSIWMLLMQHIWVSSMLVDQSSLGSTRSTFLFQINTTHGINFLAYDHLDEKHEFNYKLYQIS